MRKPNPSIVFVVGFALIYAVVHFTGLIGFPLFVVVLGGIYGMSAYFLAPLDYNEETILERAEHMRSVELAAALVVAALISLVIGMFLLD